MGEETGWLGTVPAMRRERHYGDRIVRCFAKRPRSAYQLLADAAARRPEGEALIALADAAINSILARSGEATEAAFAELGEDGGNGLMESLLLDDLVTNGSPQPGKRPK